MKTVRDLKIKIFADGARIDDMKKAYSEGIVKGFTTNPTLMKQAGIKDYESFAKDVLREITDLPISFEVFSDDFESMEREARKIASWGKNVNIKIPITNTKGESSIPLIKKLSHDGLSLNVTAIMPMKQIEELALVLNPKVKSIVSVFAGRIADTGMDPVPLMREAVKVLKGNSNAELLWASPRELLNIFQAEECGCHIITVLPDILKKLPLVGKDLAEYSLETVKMFYNDAQAAGFKI
jgi:transaldolase